MLRCVGAVLAGVRGGWEQVYGLLAADELVEEVTVAVLKRKGELSAALGECRRSRGGEGRRGEKGEGRGGRERAIVIKETGRGGRETDGEG